MKSLLSALDVHLSTKTQTNQFARWWDRARLKHPSLLDCDSLEVLWLSLRGGERNAVDYARRDRLLRTLVESHRLEPGGNWAVALLFAYLRTIRRATAHVQWMTCGRLIGRDDVESEAVRLFLALLVDLNLETNRDIHTSLARRLSGQLIRWAQSEAAVLERDESNDLASSAVLPIGERPARRREGWELDASGLVFDELLDRGVIDIGAHRLLLGSVVYGLPLKQLVAEPANANLSAPSYEATKKRVQRARREIRDYLQASDLRLTELANAACQRKTSNSNVPIAQEVGSKKERDAQFRAKAKGTNHEFEEQL